jgi:uncharacterized protein YbjT (DUF2867 family)
MILITGASGNVGGEVLRQAAAAGLKLRAAYQSAERGAPAGAETVLICDIADVNMAHGPVALRSTNAQVAQKLSDAVGRTISYVDLPQRNFERHCSRPEPEWSADALLDLQRFYREGGASVVDQTFERLTGRKATSFDQFARDYAGVFRSESRAAS